MSSPSPPRTKNRPALITDYFAPLSASQSQQSRKSPTVLGSTGGWMIGRLFTTRFGLVGASQCHTRQGDEIFYLPGCSMSVVLRPSQGQDGCYKLVVGRVNAWDDCVGRSPSSAGSQTIRLQSGVLTTASSDNTVGALQECIDGHSAAALSNPGPGSRTWPSKHQTA